MLSGETVEVHDALALGLIDEITTPDQVVSRALEIAHQFTAAPVQTFRLHKQQLRAEASHRMRQAVTEHTSTVTDAWLAEGPRRFAEAYLASLKTRR